MKKTVQKRPLTNKEKRTLCFIASLLVSIIIPLAVTIWKYNMFGAFIVQKTSVQISIIGTIICLILVLIFFKKILNHLGSLEFSFPVAVAKGFVRLVPLLLITSLLVFMLKTIDDFLFVFSWIIGCNVISKLLIDPLIDYYTNLAKKDIQKDVVREAIK